MTKFTIVLIPLLVLGRSLDVAGPQAQGQHNLLAHARRIMFASSWIWIDDRRLLEWSSKPGEEYHYKAFALDADTGQMEELSSLNERIHRELGPKQIFLWTCISPDGRWLLWSGHEAISGLSTGFSPLHWYAASLDGKEWITGADDAYAGKAGVFTQDQKQWVTISTSAQGRTFVVLALTGPQAGRCVKEDATLRELQDPPGYIPLGLTHEGRIVARAPLFRPSSPSVPSGGPDIVLCDFGIEQDAAPARKWVVHAPDGVRVEDLALSRQGDRLAWLC